jgi:hypothetical protein
MRVVFGQDCGPRFFTVERPVSAPMYAGARICGFVPGTLPASSEVTVQVRFHWHVATRVAPNWRCRNRSQVPFLSGLP